MIQPVQNSVAFDLTLVCSTVCSTQNAFYVPSKRAGNVTGSERSGVRASADRRTDTPARLNREEPRL